MKLTRTDLKVINAATTENSRPVLTGLLIKDGNIIASDGHILAHRKVTPENGDGIEPDNGYLIPVEMIKKLKPNRYQELNLVVKGEMTTMNITKGGTDIEPYLSSHMMLGNFPNYDGLFPKTKKNRRNHLIGWCIA